VNQGLLITLDTGLLLPFTSTLTEGVQLSTDRSDGSGKRPFCQFLATLKV